ncbi:hypothetical protein VP1G_03223 [Cytospora mali]|uniref:alpha-galactosidase n=1 Tax=Cytospora mali TaxID=578113 RepID=A0A194UW58_CYTMA|nr:hypothetical protein VP1G_03223 [Valsa mali var. pyri (nom. inval.)]
MDPPPLPTRPGDTNVPATTAPQTSFPPPQVIRPLWQPTVGTTWNYVLHHPVRLDQTIETSQVWIIDLFDNPASNITALHRRGRKVIAYFSAGTYEPWRPDASLFHPSDLGRGVDGWEGERWLRTGSERVREVMLARLDMAAAKGFDGVDPDNVDGYDNRTGLKLSRGDAVEYVLWLAGEAHARGLSIGLKNAGDIVPRVVDHVQWCVNEQAVQYGDEEQFEPFVRQGKPVFHVEYPKGDDADSDKQNDGKEVTGKKRDKCMKGKQHGFSTIIKNTSYEQLELVEF